jgi:hypothetical protein
MTERRPRTIFFLHIPKTAGLTLRGLISRQYARSQILVPSRTSHRGRTRFVRHLMEGDDAPFPEREGRTDPQRRIVSALPGARLADLRVVMGHLWYGIHEEVPGPFTYLTILRDPVDRVLSTYHHRATRHGLAMSVEDYIRSERGIDLDNGQTRRLAGARPSSPGTRPCPPEVFERAVTNMHEHFSVVGLTEQFELSILAMARTFRWRKLGFVSQNVSRSRPRVEDLSPEALAILRRHNEYDQELLELARRRLAEQVESLGIDPERDVAALRRRRAVFRVVRPPYDAARAAVAGLVRPRSPSG